MILISFIETFQTLFYFKKYCMYVLEDFENKGL